MQNQFKETVNEVRRVGNEASLLYVVNRKNPNKLLDAAASELDEYSAELEKHGSPDFDEWAAVDELGDSGVFLFTRALASYPELLTADPIGRVNGYGKHSGAIEALKPVILDIQDNPDRALPETIARMYSIANYAPHPGTGLEYMRLTVEKVLGNRPPYLYSIYCPILKRTLNPDEAELKYQHLELGTRMIRDTVQRTMQVQDWWPYKDLLLDWINSRESLNTLEKRLSEQHSDVTQNEVVIYGN